MDILTWCLGACIGARAGGASVLVLVLADLARDAPPAEGFPHSSSPCVFFVIIRPWSPRYVGSAS